MFIKTNTTIHYRPSHDILAMLQLDEVMFDDILSEMFVYTTQDIYKTGKL